MRKLDRAKAYAQFLPKPLNINIESSDSMAFSSVRSLSKNDLGRGLLNHKYYHLTETLSVLDDENMDNKLESQVELALIDNLILTTSLKCFVKSKNLKQSGNLALLVPNTAYAYPLLLTYHLILQHLGEGLVPTIGGRFTNDKGILIVTDNIELHSHVWRTSIRNTYLRKFIETYIIKGSKFAKFNLSKGDVSSESADGSLPWLCFYRAVRLDLLETLEKIPEVIILDLIPTRHRYRARALIEWAKKKSNHLIIVAPLFDDSTYSVIRDCGAHIFAVDPVNLNNMKSFFTDDDTDFTSSVTASWSLKASNQYLTLDRPTYYIHSIIGTNMYEDKLNELLSLTTKYHSFRAMKKLIGAISVLSNIIIPLEIYEHTLSLSGKPSLLTRINSCEKIMPENEDERRVYKTILPLSVKLAKEIYSILMRFQNSPRGEAILKVINENLNKNLLIITSDNLGVNEFKVWLRVKTGLTAKDLINVSVITQDDWSKNQLREVYLERNSIPNVVVLANVWRPKFLSSFLFPSNAEIHCISFEYEEGLFIKQINKVNCINHDYQINFVDLFKELYEITLPNSSTKIKPNIIKSTVSINSARGGGKDYEVKATNVNELFDDQNLLSMFEYDEEEYGNEDSLDYLELIDLEAETTSIDEFIRTIKIQVNINDCKKILFIEQGSKLNVVRWGSEDIVSITPLELINGDIWVKIKGKQRRELFETVLNLASNTMVMKWIQLNMSEWRDMVKLLWQRYHNLHSSRKNTYEKIMNAINSNGGNVETYLTISNWINGDVTAVRDEKNVKAVAILLNDQEYTSRWQIIHKAMRTLWNIHIRLGKVLVKIITESASRLSSYDNLIDEWVDLGMDIKLPLGDVFNALELAYVIHIDAESDYYIHQRFLEKTLTEQDVSLLFTRGWIKNESN